MVTYHARLRKATGYGALAPLHPMRRFGGATSAERQRVVSAVLKPWLAPGVLYKRMWNSLSAGQVPPPPVPTDSSMMVIEKRQYSGE